MTYLSEFLYYKKVQDNKIVILEFFISDINLNKISRLLFLKQIEYEVRNTPYGHVISIHLNTFEQIKLAYSLLMKHIPNAFSEYVEFDITEKSIFRMNMFGKIFSYEK